ncbi:M23 family metallopeptidase [Novosphingobium mangrovi (ex Huang et al. 2023)]|uniref:M23 family metallopeptidase n=1 Tax=Novosphingobium mangrovi (ex Huang et al. 2023) TaxID=2976432 RepID=A0ABT2I5G3_9SPHN|nr:M23 family metallopeptidase [Novosphingobium mangrovi (ex Huang et al. 2023)]MCT2400052.1 M23 family metallopeptidase [Novosphingobium mangrovi (ex Huang et al. 2023)]
MTAKASLKAVAARMAAAAIVYPFLCGAAQAKDAPQMAHLQDVNGTPTGSGRPGSTDSPGENATHIYVEAPTGTVSVGASYATGGAWRYPDRSGDGHGFAVVGFSAVPVYPRVSLKGVPLGLPVSAAHISSSYGLRRHPILGGVRQHAGVDLAVPEGTPVKATTDGVVTHAGWSGGYGLLVQVRQAKGVETRYAHLSHISTSVGQHVKAGDVLGQAGSTGRSTGPHVHYEVRVDGHPVNPLSK